MPGDGSSGRVHHGEIPVRNCGVNQSHGTAEYTRSSYWVNPERCPGRDTRKRRKSRLVRSRGAVCGGQSKSPPGPVWNTGRCPTISRMTVTLLTSQSAPTTTEADALVTGVFQGQDGPVLTLNSDEIDLMAALTALGATGKAEEITKIPTGRPSGGSGGVVLPGQQSLATP